MDRLTVIVVRFWDSDWNMGRLSVKLWFKSGRVTRPWVTWLWNCGSYLGKNRDVFLLRSVCPGFGAHL